MDYIEDEEDVDALLAKSQRDLDALMAKTEGTMDLLLEDNIYKPADRKKSKHHKESKEDTEDFGAKPERKKSKKHKDKECEDSLETESISEKKHKDKKHKDEHGEEDGHGGDDDKKKKKRKKSEKKDGKSTAATSRATSRGASPTPSLAPTEVEVLDESGEPKKRGGKCVWLTYDKPYKVPVHDRFRQITRDVSKLDLTIDNIQEKEKIYKTRMVEQKYWQQPKARNLDRKERGIIPEREPRGPGRTHKEIHTYMPLSQSNQTNMPITLSSQTIHPSPVQVQGSASFVGNGSLALAASMRQMAASRQEEARFERERDDKLIYMNTKLMDSLSSLGRCVENLAVARTPMTVNQYYAMPANGNFY